MKLSVKIFIGLLVLVSLGLAGFSGFMYMDAEQYKENYQSLSEDYESLLEETKSFDSSYHYLTYLDDSGFVRDLDVSVASGDGSIHLEINNTAFEVDTQGSAVDARDVADLHTDLDLESDHDVYLDFDPKSELVSLGGPSAGAAQTLAIISAANEQPLDDEVVITGTIEVDGSIGAVGGVEEKVEAAEEMGFETVLVPEGQSVYMPGIDVVEVSHIEEAMYEVGLEPRDVEYPELELEVGDFSFVNEVYDYQNYDPHPGVYESNEWVELYFEIEGFELDEEGYAEYQQYVTIVWPDGTVDPFFDEYLWFDDELDGVQTIWFTNEYEPPSDGWMEGEHEVIIEVVDPVGDKDIMFTETFIVE
ncbi:S16 family serine protease [Methanonatronarchaeum sp. AMET-Sl]|uniref:S16 family serine protease n=1 Tax=Methanonatronarchaeum sp. AMET-Sl TaxID=3037654 RepID=UPI00244DDB1B|nr:S16 family serine protease [Methanonatronarchaeum sp. AMET-Sl]WGI18092.1 hypothetical protein QEN48_03570 [Methanonatronarchaeum sp. AMET-Sl]